MAELVQGAVVHPDVEESIREDDKQKLMTVANLYTVLRRLIDAGHGDSDVKIMVSPAWEDLYIDIAMMSPKMGALFLMGGLDADDVKLLEEQGMEDWEPNQTVRDAEYAEVSEHIAATIASVPLPGTTPAKIREAVSELVADSAEFDPDAAESA